MNKGIPMIFFIFLLLLLTISFPVNLLISIITQSVYIPQFILSHPTRQKTDKNRPQEHAKRYFPCHATKWTQKDARCLALNFPVELGGKTFICCYRHFSNRFLLFLAGATIIHRYRKVKSWENSPPATVNFIFHFFLCGGGDTEGKFLSKH